MSNPLQDYVDNFRANLPSGVTYDADIARYFANGKRFLNEWDVERYVDYINKFSLFSPTFLFQNSKSGAWYDPSDLTTLFQDSAATTPVTADGDPVGYIGDKSSNGNHATQSTSEARPTYRTDGILHWLEFDGVDDALDAGEVVLDVTNPFSVFDAVQATATGPMVIHGNANTLTPSSGFIRYNNGSDRTLSRSSDAAIQYIFSPPNTDMVTSTILSGGTQVFRFNGVQRGSTSSVTNNVAVGTYKIGVSQTNFLSGKIFQLILRNAATTGSDLDDVEAFLSEKSGVTL